MKVYNTVGSLTYVKERLAWNKVDDFHSLNGLLTFLDNYDATREQTISDQKKIITAERSNLAIEIKKLEEEIETQNIHLRQQLTNRIENLEQHITNLVQADKSYLQEITYSFRAVFNMLKVQWLKLTFDRTIYKALIAQVNLVGLKRKRLEYIDANFENAAKENCTVALYELDRKKKIIDELKTFIYGAIGEQMVVKTLQCLSDEYILINDFNYTFAKPLVSRKDNLYIKSIQLDHVLISTAGIFLIETKNWSKESLNNLSLRSPIEQIKRANFALSKLVAPMADVRLGKHHWGDRKIPIRNVIVMINQKPREEFNYVKILTLNELHGYITYFKPNLLTSEVETITRFLNKISESNGKRKNVSLL